MQDLHRLSRLKEMADNPKSILETGKFNSFIYGLREPDTKKFRYIGQTANLITRYKQHCDFRQYEGNLDKYKWVYSLKKRELKPEMVLLEGLYYNFSQIKEIRGCEKEWILFGLSEGWDLLNRIPNNWKGKK